MGRGGRGDVGSGEGEMGGRDVCRITIQQARGLHEKSTALSRVCLSLWGNERLWHVIWAGISCMH